MDSITLSNNFAQLLQECRSIIVEHEFMSRWTLIEGYHALGKTLTEFNTDAVTVTRLATELHKTEKTFRRARQFYTKYPDLELLPEGKNTSWHKIVNKYLPETVEEKEPRMFECPNCHEITEL